MLMTKVADDSSSAQPLPPSCSPLQLLPFSETRGTLLGGDEEVGEEKTRMGKLQQTLYLPAMCF